MSGEWVRGEVGDPVFVPGAPVIPPATPSLVIYRPGGVTAPPVYATDSEVAARIVAAAGDIEVNVDDSITSPAPWTVNVDCQGRTVWSGQGDFSPSSSPAILEVADGTTILNPGEISAVLVIASATTGVPAIRRDKPGPLTFSGGAMIRRAAAATAEPVVFDVSGGGPGIAVCLAGTAGFSSDTNTDPVVKIAPGTTLLWIALNTLVFGGSPLPSQIVSGDATTSLGFGGDSSSFLPAMYNPAFLGTIILVEQSESAQGTLYDDKANILNSRCSTTADFTVPTVWTAATFATDDPAALHVGDTVIVDNGGTDPPAAFLITTIAGLNVTGYVLNVAAAPAPAAPYVLHFAGIVQVQRFSVQNAIDALRDVINGVLPINITDIRASATAGDIPLSSPAGPARAVWQTPPPFASFAVASMGGAIPAFLLLPGNGVMTPGGPTVDIGVVTFAGRTIRKFRVRYRGDPANVGLFLLVSLGRNGVAITSDGGVGFPDQFPADAPGQFDFEFSDGPFVFAAGDMLTVRIETQNGARVATPLVNPVTQLMVAVL